MLEFDFSFPTTFGFDVVITILWIKLQLRVDLTGDQTQKVFDRILTNLGRIAPPIPGFCIQKGGKKMHFLYHADLISRILCPFILIEFLIVFKESIKLFKLVSCFKKTI